MKNRIVFRKIFIFLILFCIFLMVPYNHDEWAWGTNEGIENLKNFFQGYNGRYFGDIISILITRSSIFKAFVMTTSTLGVYFSIKKFYQTLKADKKIRQIILSMVFLLLLLVPTPLFRQIYGWPAAFVNFVPPVIFVILYLLFSYETVINPDMKNRSLASGIFVTLGTQFFSENITIFMLVLTFSIFLAEKIMNKKSTLFAIGAFITALLGTVIMFVNPAYLNAANNTDGYKKIELSLGFIWNKISSQMIPNMILNYQLLLIIFNIGLLILIFKKVENLKFLTKAIISFVIWYTVYGVFFYGHMNFSYRFDNTIINIFTIVYFLCLIKIVLLLFSGRELLFNLIILVSIPFSAAPLIIAEPIGARSFYLTYCLWVLYTGIIYFKIFENVIIPNRLFGMINSGIKIVVGSMLILYLLIFSYMYRVQVQRENIISEAVQNNKSEIVLPLLPNENYTWKTSTGPDNWLVRFKKFYNIPEDKNVIFK